MLLAIIIVATLLVVILIIAGRIEMREGAEEIADYEARNASHSHRFKQ